MARADRGPPALSAAAIALLSAAASLALQACSVAGYASLEDAEEEELPTARFTDYSHTVVERGRKLLELKASTAELYDASKRTVLVDVAFSEFDPDDGELLSLGKADRAVYHTDTKDAEFSGSVTLESRRQDAILRGEYLRWIDKDKRLEGRLDRTVTVSRADGSFVSGAGFEASGLKRSFSFRESVEGMVTSKDEPAAEAGESTGPGPGPGGGE
jgi:LPS export ABC transporter protein LptC